VLTITQMTLGNLKPGQKAHIEAMQFEVRLEYVAE
jgi:hypothetical protein